MRMLNRMNTGKIIYCLLVLFIAAGLKYTYSQSTSEDLQWILGPTASLVEALTGEQFMKEQNIGYVSVHQRIAIIPGCSGINFMIAAFCMLTISLVCSTNRKQYLTLYLMAGFAAVAEPAITVILGEKWLPSVPFLQINLIVYGFIVPFSSISPITTLSIKHSKRWLC